MCARARRAARTHHLRNTLLGTVSSSTNDATPNSVGASATSVFKCRSFSACARAPPMRASERVAQTDGATVDAADRRDAEATAPANNDDTRTGSTSARLSSASASSSESDARSPTVNGASASSSGSSSGEPRVHTVVERMRNDRRRIDDARLAAALSRTHRCARWPARRAPARAESLLVHAMSKARSEKHIKNPYEVKNLLNSAVAVVVDGRAVRNALATTSATAAFATPAAVSVLTTTSSTTLSLSPRRRRVRANTTTLLPSSTSPSTTTTTTTTTSDAPAGAAAAAAQASLTSINSDRSARAAAATVEDDSVDDVERHGETTPLVAPAKTVLSVDVRGRRSDLSSAHVDALMPVSASARRVGGLARCCYDYCCCCCCCCFGERYFPRRLVPLIMLVLAIFLQSFFDEISGVSVASAAAREKWSARDVALITESFDLGYGLSCLLGAAISYRFGFKAVTGIGVVAHALLTMGTPFIIASWSGLLVLRTLCGIAEGCVLPSAYVMIRRVAPWRVCCRTARLIVAA